jgi:hypothetical protein
MAWSVSSTTGGPTGVVAMVTRKRVAISSKTGAGSPAAWHAAIMRWTPLHHCSIKPSAWTTLPITRLRSFETPSGRSSTVRPKGRSPGFSISRRSSKIDRRIGAPRSSSSHPANRASRSIQRSNAAAATSARLS